MTNTNRQLTSINLTNNSLKEILVADALNVLKENTTLFTIRLEGNAISTKKMKLLYETLECNKNRVKRDKIPSYQKEITRLNALLSDSDAVEAKIKEVAKEHKEEKKAVDSAQEVFNRVKNSQMKKSEVVIRQKESADNKMKRVNKEMEEVSKTYDRLRQEYEQKIKDLKENMRRANASINNLTVQGTNVHNRSERGKEWCGWKYAVECVYGE